MKVEIKLTLHKKKPVETIFAQKMLVNVKNNYN